MSPAHFTPFIKPNAGLIVFTDLDGTLLDHHTYTFEPARPALAAIKTRGIPLIPVTSKTVPEVAELRRKLDNPHPFIVENGVALVLPHGYFPEMGESTGLLPDASIVRFSPTYDTLRAKFTAWRDEHQFKCTGFGDWDDSGVAAATGLRLADAHRARQRLGSEPFIWEDTSLALEKLYTLATKANLRIVKGGRFFHLIGQTDKAHAARELLRAYRTHYNFVPDVVSLGDSQNDHQMLQLADYAVIIKKPDGSHFSCETQHEKICTEGIGPIGWNEAITKILKERGE